MIAGASAPHSSDHQLDYCEMCRTGKRALTLGSGKMIRVCAVRMVYVFAFTSVACSSEKTTNRGSGGALSSLGGASTSGPGGASANGSSASTSGS